MSSNGERTLGAVVMAAGLGTRMRSDTPKHLHPILGRRMVDWVLGAAAAIDARPIVVVTSPATAEAFDGLPVAVHAESPARLITPAGAGWRDFVASRPVDAELEAIADALALAKETGCSLHVVHVSSGEGVELVARAQRVDATCETCPHYLTLTEDDLETLGTRATCAPPLRPAHEREALWQHLAAGRIALVASDHSPCPPAMKEGAFTDAWGGIAGCQSLLQLVLERLPPAAAAALTSANVAARFDLPKARMEPGADADLVLIDLRERHAPELLDRHRLSPFAGRPLMGRVVRTLVRGTTVYRDGRIVAEPLGRLLKPKGAA